MVAVGSPAEVKESDAVVHVYSVSHSYQRNVTSECPYVHLEYFHRHFSENGVGSGTFRCSGFSLPSASPATCVRTRTANGELQSFCETC